MSRKSEERRKNPQSARNGGRRPAEKKRKPRGAIIHGDDPTLAKRVEEELYGFGR